jgi:thiol:disulfide interchange protein DsbD
MKNVFMNIINNYMQKFIVAIVLILGSFHFGISQVLTPVKWSFSYEAIDENHVNLIYTAEIDKGWTVYSVFTEEGGPVPTSIEYEELNGAEVIGKAVETGKIKEGFDKLFEVDVIKVYGPDPYQIKQKIKLLDGAGKISGYLTYMCCDDSKCLPPTDEDFAFNINLSDKPVENLLPGEIGKETAGNIENEDLPGDSGIEEVVKWDYTIENLDNGSHSLSWKASISPGWYIYSQELDEGGPEPTEVVFEESEGYEFVGETKESGDIKTGLDPIFEMEVTKYSSKKPFVLSQVVNSTSPGSPLTGYLSYMVCNDAKCIMEEAEFQFDLESGYAGVPKAGFGSLANIVGDTIDQAIPTLQASYAKPLATCGNEIHSHGNNIIWMFILGFLGGLVALLTPCVFPMIPLTVSYFTKDTKRKGWVNGTIYGASIIVIYVTIGIALTAIFGEEALNRLSTNWIANTLFFLIFIVFAFSFFGFYEITLPSSWANKTDQAADKGGLIGIFFMAFTLALVSFSCTGPIIGSAIVEAAANQVGPFVVMLGFAVALALPFGLFAAFPAWLNTLPRSGSWMNSVKVVLGFLELALAFKFLSVADMTNHWNFLKYELFMGVWVLIFAALTLYLFGIIKFPHDSPMKKLSKTRGAFAFGFLALTVYLASGFLYNDETKSYNSLKLMSGLAPPANYNFFLPEPEVDPLIKDKYPSYTKCANNISCFKDYYDGLSYAREVNKPILLDHTGYGCVNCRKTEEHIWVDERIKQKLNDEFVLVSLYVDDDKELEQPLISKSRKKKIRNIGNKWADFQIVNFKQNSQPLYIMITPEEEVISAPRGYQEGIEDYNSYLECGLNYYKNGSKEIN